jgi:hypothetical protein
LDAIRTVKRTGFELSNKVSNLELVGSRYCKHALANWVVPNNHNQLMRHIRGKKYIFLFISFGWTSEIIEAIDE